jgi:hypothetical protein
MKERSIDPEKLFKVPEVIEEIKRHLWIESEKAGYDIGFNRAKEDWIKHYSKAWVGYYKPANVYVTNGHEPVASKGREKKSAVSKKRSAKSYAG